MRKLLWLLLLPSASQAQTIPPAQPQPEVGLAQYVEFEIRLKGPPTATNPNPTVRLIKTTFRTIDGRYFNYVEPCWNKTTPCKITGATVSVFAKVPWTPRLNVTRHLVCPAPECSLPSFQLVQAQPKEAFQFRYDRVTATWAPTPKVIPAP